VPHGNHDRPAALFAINDAAEHGRKAALSVNVGIAQVVKIGQAFLLIDNLETTK
jgi:hypothetical protein